MLESEEIEQFSTFICKKAVLECSDIRKQISLYLQCSKYKEYCDEDANDLNPQRLYQFPVRHRNHPKECYLPSRNNEDNSSIKCTSSEVLLRKAMVHYQNARKMHNLFIEGAKAHRLLCDIDASAILGDIEYLSKIIKIRLQKPSTIAEIGNSEARQWTSETIIQRLSAQIQTKNIKGKKQTYLENFQQYCNDIPKHKCWSCNVLSEPSKTHKIDIDKWKYLKYDPENNQVPNEAYIKLNNFLVEHNLVEKEKEVSDIQEDEALGNHPAKFLHGISICSYCCSCLNNNRTPARSLLNNMFTGECPKVIKELNPIEMMFIRQVKCFQKIVKPGPISGKLPDSERISALKGRFIHLPLSTEQTFNQLKGDKNKQLFDLEDYVYCNGRPMKDKTVWRHLVDRIKVNEALK